MAVNTPVRTPAARARDAVSRLERLGSREIRDALGPRYGIHTTRAFGVPMSAIQSLARQLGRDHALAEALWKTGWYEARLLAAMVDEPARVTRAQMNRWCRDFDNWGICDTVCFKLFDQAPHAWAAAGAWAERREEFVKRAAFALLASLALHDRQSPDERFLRALPLVERGASDERNFVKKGVSWALRGIGRRSATLRREATSLARRLAESEFAAARWVGRDALRDLTRSPPTPRRAATRRPDRGRRDGPAG